MRAAFRKLQQRIKALAGGQIAVLVIIALALAYMLWAKAGNLDSAATLARVRSDYWNAAIDSDNATLLRYGAAICAAMAAFIAFTWYGRKHND